MGSRVDADDLYIEYVEGAINRVADCLSRIAEELPESEIRHLKEAEDIINFPISLYFAERMLTCSAKSNKTRIQDYCFMMVNADPSDTQNQMVDLPLEPSTSRGALKELPLNQFQKQESLDSEDESIPESWEDRVGQLIVRNRIGTV